MNIRYNAILLVFLSCFLFSCEDDGYADYDAGQTNTKELSGEWYVSKYSMSGELLSGYYLLSTYNTADNDNTIFVDDNENLFPLKVKATGDVENLIFSTTDAANLYDEEGVATITEGLIIPNGTEASGSRTIVDSLSFQIELANDPDSPYIVAGYRDTGFAEDDH